MCDYGRLNYKWIGAENRLTEVKRQESRRAGKEVTVARRANQRPLQGEAGSVAMIISRGARMRGEFTVAGQAGEKFEAVRIPSAVEGGRQAFVTRPEPEQQRGSGSPGIQPAEWIDLVKIAAALARQHQDADVLCETCEARH